MAFLAREYGVLGVFVAVAAALLFLVGLLSEDSSFLVALSFTAGLQREVRMQIDRGGSCTPELHVSFMVVELAIIAGRAGQGFLVTYAVVDERDMDLRPNMGATWARDRTQALLDAGRSAGAGIRGRTPRE